MARLSRITTAVLEQVWSRLQQIQNTYFAAHGRYWQGLPTHNEAPDEDRMTSPDQLSRKPADQAEGWREVWGGEAESLPVRVRVDVYDGPQGKGYVATMSYRRGGNVVTSSFHHGPERWRDTQEEEVIP